MKIFLLKRRFAFNEQSLADPLRLNVNLSSSICSLELVWEESKSNQSRVVSVSFIAQTIASHNFWFCFVGKSFTRSLNKLSESEIKERTNWIHSIERSSSRLPLETLFVISTNENSVRTKFTSQLLRSLFEVLFRAIPRKGFPLDAAACFQLMEVPKHAKVFAISSDLKLFNGKF